MTHARAAASATIVACGGRVAALVVLDDSSSDLAKIVVGGWVTALGNVIGYYFGASSVEV